jgi:outer membrane immunogenic protein
MISFDSVMVSRGIAFENCNDWGDNMKKIIVAAAFAILGATAIASAADLPMKAAPAPLPPPPSWTGFYFGGNAGFLVGHDQSGTTNFTQPGAVASNPAFNTAAADSWIAGGQIGYNWQVSPSWVIGFEGDFDGTDPKHSFCRGTDSGSAPCFDNGRGFLTFSEKTEWLASARGRLGYVLGSVLLYGTAGGAWGKVDTTITASCAVEGCGNSGATNITTFSSNNVRGGWVAGVGAEAMIAPNWTVKGEWLHYDLGNFTTAFLTPAAIGSYGVSYSRRLEYDTIRFGVNYKFGWAGPVVAKY